MKSLLFVASIALALPADGQPLVGGRIRGAAVDVVGASIAAASIKVLNPDSHATLDRVHADDRGIFETGALPSGSYIITVSAAGFRGRFLTGTEVREARVTDLGAIRLDVAGCDGPGVNCDIFLSAERATVAPAPEARLSSGYLDVKLNCGFNLAICAPDAPTKPHRRPYLVPSIFDSSARRTAFSSSLRRER